MEKGTRVDQIATATRLLHDAGIEVGFFLQFGYPGETRDDIEQTLQMVRDVRAGRHRRLGVVSAAGHAVLRARARRSSAQKQNWVDSDDLAMMYRATYVAGVLPRAARAACTREFRARATSLPRAASARARPRDARSGSTHRRAARR